MNGSGVKPLLVRIQGNLLLLLLFVIFFHFSFFPKYTVPNHNQPNPKPNIPHPIIILPYRHVKVVSEPQIQTPLIPKSYSWQPFPSSGSLPSIHATCLPYHPISYTSPLPHVRYPLVDITIPTLGRFYVKALLRYLHAPLLFINFQTCLQTRNSILIMLQLFTTINLVTGPFCT